MFFGNTTSSFSRKMVWQLLLRGSGVGRKETLVTSLLHFYFRFYCLMVVGYACCVRVLRQFKSCEMLYHTACKGY